MGIAPAAGVPLIEFRRRFGAVAAGRIGGVDNEPRARGAGYRIRTRGPLITNQVLYQLS
jgi:hypothetical protein